MKGDFSRSTFRPEKRYASVRMQQGRVQLDADWNEQADIQAHLLEKVVRDLIGPCGGPEAEPAFGIVTGGIGPGDFLLTAGRYYVDGILCENEAAVAYTTQPHRPRVEPLGEGRHLVYLDVWRRDITAVEDPEIREVALGGPDTATRLQTVWQVKALPVGEEAGCRSEVAGWEELVRGGTGRLAARSDGGYRGLENHLYRVEIHDPGGAGRATFKWSRDNGSVVFPITGMEGNRVGVSGHGREAQKLGVGDWVEGVDDAYVLAGRAEPLLQVTEVNDAGLRVTLSSEPAGGVGSDPSLHPFLRRWDRGGAEGTARGLSGVAAGTWTELEDGVQVRFEPGDLEAPYRTGDYWQIPARPSTGDVEWPEDDSAAPVGQLPHGIRHHYCRLGIVVSDGRQVELVEDCRKLFPAATDRGGP
jgi:hypothetical protein